MDTKSKNEIAVFGGGCFWCTEAVFKMMKGVTKVVPGYAGGKIEHPTYDEVCGGDTGHAEVVHIEYDPSQVRYEDLLTVFFGSHNPTTLNRQGADVGTQYRSVVFYTTPEQKEIAEKFIKDIDANDTMGAAVVTEVSPLINYSEAENYHHDYFTNHKDQGYCQAVINPKLEKVQAKYADLLQDIYKK